MITRLYPVSGSRRICQVLAGCCVVFLLMLVSAQIATASASTASECLQEISHAVKSGDADGVSRLMDIDGIASAALAEVEKTAHDANTSQWLPPVITLMASRGALTNPSVQPFLVRELREFVLYGVGSGGFGGHRVDTYKSNSMLGPLFSMASMGAKEIADIGQPSEQSDGRTIIPFRVHDDNGSVYPVQGIFSRDAAGSWRLTGIGNLQELILQISMEAQ